MALIPEEFLRQWRHSYIDAEAREVKGVDDTVNECIDDARKEGITSDELERAAGENLRIYKIYCGRHPQGEC